MIASMPRLTPPTPAARSSWQGPAVGEKPQPPLTQEVPGAASARVSVSAISLRRLETLRLVTAPAVLAAPAAGRLYKTLAEVGQDLQEDLAGFGGLFGSALQSMESKLGADGGLSFALDGRGHVLMDRGQQAPGERTALGDDPLFAARFAVIAARSAILNAAQTLPGFKADYQRDAGQAIRTHVDALAQKLFGYRLHVDDGRIESGYGWSDARQVPA